MRLLPLILLTLLPACAEFPAVAARVPEVERQGEPPPLVPIASILSQARGPGVAQAAERQGQSVLGRVAALRARAAGLRGPVLSPANRARLARGVDLSPLN